MEVKYVSVAEAAQIAERSEPTIRRWIKQSKISRHMGPVPEHGGSAPLRIDQAELLQFLAVKGQQPRTLTTSSTEVISIDHSDDLTRLRELYESIIEAICSNTTDHIASLKQQMVVITDAHQHQIGAMNEVNRLVQAEN
ncbi:MAG: helix-turn-helix domain-containing protein, partial [Gammaproteobacteria bacterium]|nr:helix-turn-helix domain-containing protein [Gammaproteobacteria bacterium]